ncbi:Tyrosine-protein phosphatase non-receptor type 20 [Golovinomyces cichoracearum]|uniref:Tyrosine-protein phosphatase non-receptor type 20 n=1 Tax=Golovinomyces cichoracearum TaxID=62708 RepID=A0A420IGB3_9PEZI|nr:Tyrosine-protein phosphatase non-receptor type 20 [Golovinomyces cichoracearum]
MARREGKNAFTSLEDATRSASFQSSMKVKRDGSSHSSMPAFLSLSNSAIAEKFNLIDRYEKAIAARPTSFLKHTSLSNRDRYPDIRPWAHNIIRLDALKFPENYINASPISLGTIGDSYIATQGPGPGDTVMHFWQMVWQEKVEVIVMLTRYVEAGKVKCGVYMPLQISEKIQIHTGPALKWGEIECVSQQTEHWGEIRRFRILRKRDSKYEEHYVYHLLFMSWPDHQVPKKENDQMALLNLTNLSRQITGRPDYSTEAQKPPRIVHCSAGVGRTGTFIALDYLLRELEHDKWDNLPDHEDPIFDTVQRLREQRMGLVNNIQQYTFIYKILRESWKRHNSLKSTPSAVVNAPGIPS